MRRSLAFGAVSALLLASCGSEDPQRNDLPYTGSAWPEQRPTYSIARESLAIVTNNYSDTISLLDLQNNQVVATAPIDLDPLAVDGPHHAVVDPAGEFIYTPLAYPREGAGSGPHANHGASAVPGVLLKLRVRDLSRVGTLTVENNPGDIVMTRDGSKMVVSHFDLSRAIEGMKANKPLAELRAPIVIVDTATMTRVASPAPCIAAHGMTFSADDKTLYLACYGEDAVGVVDLDDPSKSELIPLGAAPSTPANLAFGPYFITLDGASTVLVSETEGKALRRVDLATRTTTQRTPLGGAVFGPARLDDGGYLVPVQQPDSLALVDSSLAVQRSRPFSGDECIRPHQIARYGDRFMLVCEGDHQKPGKILEINPSTLETVRTFDVGVYPDIIAFPAGLGG